MKTPDSESMRFAAEWLREYDDSHDGGEQSVVAAQVADWLCAQADSQDARAVARESGVSVARLRAALKSR